MDHAIRPTDDELWALAFKRLVPWSMKRHGLNLADAEEMVQEAIRLFLAAGSIVDPSDQQGFLQALGSTVNGIAVNRGRKKALRAVGLTADGSDAEPDDPSDPEQRIVSDDVARKAVSALLERVSHDELVFELVTRVADGIEDAHEQAKVLGRDLRDIYKARRRLKTHAEAIQKLMEGW